MKTSGRYWKHFGQRGCITFEYTVRKALAFEVTVGGIEGEIFLLRLGLLFITFYIGLENWVWARKLRFPYEDARNTGFYIVPADDGLFGHLEIWQKTGEWRRGDRSWSFDFDKIVWGRKKFSKRTLWEIQREIPMPEKSYAAIMRLEERTWEQPRKFWRPVVVRRGIDIEIPEGIPHPGKGTTSYNLVDGALMGVGFNGDDPDLAVKYAQERAQWYRVNYPL